MQNTNNTKYKILIRTSYVMTSQPHKNDSSGHTNVHTKKLKTPRQAQLTIQKRVNKTKQNKKRKKRNNPS